MPAPFPNKPAYLTIDDGPSPLMAERVEFLAARNLPAIWFCRGDFLEVRPEPALAALRHGAIIGNHTYDHTYCSKLTPTRFAEQIDHTERIIERLHARAGVPRRAKYFRFPFEERIGPPEHFAALQQILRERGFTRPAFADVPYRFFHHADHANDLSLFWTYDTRDWSLPAQNDPRADTVLAEVLARMDEHDPENSLGLNEPGAAEVIVMHDHGHTAYLWEQIVERLLAKGLRFTLPA